MGVWIEGSRPDAASYSICAVVEGWYNVIISFIDQCLGWFSDICKLTISTINALYGILNAAISGVVDLIVETLRNCIPSFSLDEKMQAWRENLCEVLQKCEVFFKHILRQITSYQGSGDNHYLPDFTDLRSENNEWYFPKIADEYDWFKKVICNFSIENLLDQAGELTKQQLNDWIDRLLYDSEYGINNILDRIREAQRGYETFIKQPLKDIIPGFKTAWEVSLGFIIPPESFDVDTGNIFDLMDCLDLFMQCSLSMCEFGKSIINYKEDKRKKYHIDFKARILEPPSAYSKAMKLAADTKAACRNWKNDPATKKCFGLYD